MSGRREFLMGVSLYYAALYYAALGCYVSFYLMKHGGNMSDFCTSKKKISLAFPFLNHENIYI